MVSSGAKTVDAYLNSLPADRGAAIAKVREVILENLPRGFEEIMDFGMIAYVVPLSRYPETYNGHPIGVAALASQKQYMALHDKWHGDRKARKAVKKGRKRGSPGRRGSPPTRGPPSGLYAWRALKY
jgi:hypothetical protein